MTVQRIQNAINKKTTATKHQKREIASLLENKKDEKARIKVESIIREDLTIEAYEILEVREELLKENTLYSTILI
jgi:vacuolar protein sorting-associated protein IST1